MDDSGFGFGSWQLRQPLALLLLLLIAPLYWLLTRQRSAVAYSSTSLFDGVGQSTRSRLEQVPTLLFLLAIVSLCVAIARPQTPDSTARISREGIGIMLVIDRSGSMDARDLEEDYLNVNRLQVVKDVIKYFVTGEDDRRSAEFLTSRPDFAPRPGRSDDMIGLVAFAGFADSLCPLTLDHGNLLATVDEIKLADRQDGGTAIGEGLGLAVERLQKSSVESKVVVLLTDGVNNSGALEPLAAGDLAANANIRVYCIGAGTNGFAPIPVPNPLTGQTQLRAMPVEIDEETLTAIAEKTGGRYFRATDRDSLKEIYDEIDRLERTEVSDLKYLKFREHYAMFVVAAMLLLVTSSLLRLTVFQKLN